jgi:hypothetical protein
MLDEHEAKTTTQTPIASPRKSAGSLSLRLRRTYRVSLFPQRTFPRLAVLLQNDQIWHLTWPLFTPLPLIDGLYSNAYKIRSWCAKLRHPHLSFFVLDPSAAGKASPRFALFYTHEHNDTMYINEQNIEPRFGLARIARMGGCQFCTTS